MGNSLLESGFNENMSFPYRKGWRMRRRITVWAFWLWITCGFVPTSVLLAQTSSHQKDLLSLRELSSSLEALTQRVSPAVVQILVSAYGTTPGAARFAPDVLSQQRKSGSGVILDPEGYIVTNAHVLRGARQVRVVLSIPADERVKWRSILKPRGEPVSAHIVGVDRQTDLAVLKIEKEGLPSLELGNSDELRPGQLVMAFGSPLGLENTVTLGTVSAVGRQLCPDDPMIYVQTDASINPGNSGGPLVDTNGRVIGINTFILTQSGGSEGLGFAVPSNVVSNVFRQIRTSGRVRSGYLGVQAQTVTPTLAAGLGLAQDWGVVLADVVPSGSGDVAGLEIGDLVLSLDGKVMENARQFHVNFQYQRALGDIVTLEVLRGSRKFVKRVAVMEQPNDPGRFAELVSRETDLVEKLGVLCISLDGEIRKMLPQLRKLFGVLVAGSVVEIPHPGQLFFPGDVIYSMNGRNISDLAELRSAVDAPNAGDAVVVQVERNGKLMYLAFTQE